LLGALSAVLTTDGLSSNIYLKLDNLQPSGSFKSRGVGNMMFRAVADAGPSEDIHFYCSSGGNAGLACATSAIALNRKATIVVPTSTLPHMVQKLRDLGADVVQIGANWAEADKHLRMVLMANHDPASRAIYVPPFDHPDVWAGASELVDELAAQMMDGLGGVKPDAIVCSVGGGGLLSGIMEGIERLKKATGGYFAPRVLAMETEGADSFNSSVRAGHLVTIPKISSIATSLGAVRVADKVWDWAVKSGDNLISAVVTDAEAVSGVARFLDDARILVEVSCGAAIIPAYNGLLRRQLGRDMNDEQWAKQNIVLEICGGSNISLEMLNSYRQEYGV
jgi:L-serine/L-threonine ammonia-lyase